MSKDNLLVWDALKTTDPAQTKRFTRAGGFRGTSVKPIYSALKMTETFGPAGKGWGMHEPKFTVVECGEHTMVYCTVALWWETLEQIVYGVGGDIVMGKNSKGPFVDDEAFKKAYTDALSNAMKQIGMAADVHMGLHDDDKYVSAVNKQLHGDGGSLTPSNGAVKVEQSNTPKDKWAGPLNKTNLSKSILNLSTALRKAYDAGNLDAYMDIYSSENAKLVMEQAAKDAPIEWAGPHSEGGEPYRDYFERMRCELMDAERVHTG